MKEWKRDGRWEWWVDGTNGRSASISVGVAGPDELQQLVPGSITLQTAVMVFHCYLTLAWPLTRRRMPRFMLNKKPTNLLWWQLNGKIKWRPLVNVTTTGSANVAGCYCRRPWYCTPCTAAFRWCWRSEHPVQLVLPGNARRQTNYRPVRKHDIFRSDRFDDLIMA